MALLKGLQDEITITTTAEIDQSFGKVMPVKFDVTFRTLSHSEKKNLLAEIKAAEGEDREAWDDILPRYIRGWRMPGDAGDVPFDQDTLAEVLDAQPYRNALIEAFLGLLGGNKWLENNRRKN